MLRKIAKGAAYAVGGVVSAVAVYGAAAFGLSRIPVGSRSRPRPNDIEAYILSNGVHTDIVLPVRTAQVDWSELVPYADTPAADTTMRYIGFGWGDKGFYLDTPTWSQLKASTAFKAMFWLGTSAMHTTYHHQPNEGPDCVKIFLSAAEYARLINYIKGSFDYDAAGRVQHIQGHNYGLNDTFYEARRTYNLFYTCNTWANDALKVSGQKASLWTPMDSGIFYQYGR
ncbi:TIGR02117 family protein [Hymenobacter persicinus]|uniref:TIGR02117 family protein n=1 Tax=Hymenobacter persicinus TaxID=2025506 RepID=A0A4Q5LDD8_9BACT|nr:TIGR02117 family protein [Hymenobacter persicinus]RYU79579.1 TIGR02117 family protein [Hymenobacter persicinus]